MGIVQNVQERPVRERIRFVGRVQGVGFRATTREICSHRAVTGWVRNLPDGAVEMEIQGRASEIDSALVELRRAMSHNIRHIDRAIIEPVDNEVGFEIRR